MISGYWHKGINLAYSTRMGWCPRTGEGQRLMIRTAVNELMLIILRISNPLKHSKLIILGFLNFWKSPFEARDIVVWTKLVKILWRLPILTGCSLPAEVPLSWVPFLWHEHFPLMVLGFWIFAKLHSRPEKQVFEHRQAIFIKIWRNFLDGCSLWTAIAWLPEVQLTCLP